MSINYAEAEARLHFYADTIGVQRPEWLLSDATARRVIAHQFHPMHTVYQA